MAFAGRLRKLAGLRDRSGRPRDLPEGDIRRTAASIEIVHKIISRLPEAREPFWRTCVTCAKSNPAVLRYIVILMAFYLHLGPFARRVIATIDARLAELDAETTGGLSHSNDDRAARTRLAVQA